MDCTQTNIMIMFLDKLKSKRSVLLNVVFILICLKFYVDKHLLEKQIESNHCISEKPFPNDVTPNVKVFDLTQSLEPVEVYDQIKCKESTLYETTTNICVHDLNKDIFVSRSIWQTGLWERPQLETFIRFLHFNPDCLVIDVGAQIGIYSLFAAKMGHSVVAVEPFEDNVVRIHKAAYLENITDKITLIKNAIADKRNEIKQLESNSINVGGQGLLSFRDKKINTFDNSNKYLVETILFDDVVNFLPKLESKKAILKIDIEGYEPYAFQYSKNLFKILDIKCIFMEWGKFGETDKSNKLVNEMLNFLFANDLRPFNLETDQELERENFSKWPWDIIWKK